MTIRLRAMTEDDYVPVAALLRRNDLAVAPADDWRDLLVANPFRNPDTEIGWVLEDPEGQIVGTFGNLQLAYRWNGRSLRVAAAYAWAVDPGHREGSVRLLRRYLRQPSADLLLTSTASARVGEIFSAVRFKPVPHPEYDRALLWITDARGFAAAALRQLGLPLAGVLKLPAGLALAAIAGRRSAESAREDDAPRGREILRLERFDDRFDAFWERLQSIPDRLLAVRSAAVLSWHFARLMRQGRGG